MTNIIEHLTNKLAKEIQDSQHRRNQTEAKQLKHKIRCQLLTELIMELIKKQPTFPL